MVKFGYNSEWYLNSQMPIEQNCPTISTSMFEANCIFVQREMVYISIKCGMILFSKRDYCTETSHIANIMQMQHICEVYIIVVLIWHKKLFASNVIMVKMGRNLSLNSYCVGEKHLYRERYSFREIRGFFVLFSLKR